jgi:hypothetical protein
MEAERAWQSEWLQAELELRHANAGA